MRTLLSRITVVHEGEPIYSEMATHVTLDDEAAGPFVHVTQPGGRVDKTGICIDPDEWPVLRRAINRMVRIALDQERAEARG